jgi:hypothetical protein
MAAPVVRRVGRHSHTIQLLAEGPPLRLEQSMEAAREAVRNDLNTRQLGREPDAITTAVVSLEYDREGRPERYNVWLPVGQQPLGARGDGLDNATACSNTTSEPVWKPWMCGNLVSRSKAFEKSHSL